MKWDSPRTKLSRGRHKLLRVKAWEGGQGEDEVALPSVQLLNGSAKGICDPVCARAVAEDAIRVAHAIVSGIERSSSSVHST